MRSFSFAKALTLGALICCALPVACGDDDDASPGKGGSSATGGAGGDTTEPEGGMSAGGAAAPAPLPPGLSNMASTEKCGAETCDSAQVGPVFVNPCCAADACGLSPGFLALIGAGFKTCQAKDQPGELDAACPDSKSATVPFEIGGKLQEVPIDGFPGCCREDGTCGVAVNDVNSPLSPGAPVASLGLGCLEAAPFFAEGTKIGKCGDGVGGAGGAGMGGAGVGGAGVGGAGAGMGGTPDTGIGGASGGAGGNP